MGLKDDKGEILEARVDKQARSHTDKYLKYCEPEFLIIGTQKGGTSSLYHNLCQHPQIQPARKKEIHFFDDQYNKGLDWYKSQFPPVKLFKNILTGEASPYYFFHPYAPIRIFLSYPRIKLIILLRNPIDRAYSHYHHNIRKNREMRSFEEAIGEESGTIATEVEKFSLNKEYKSHIHKHYSYLSRGAYINQFKNWLERFSKKQFFILKSEEFFNDPEKTISRIFSFLGLERIAIDNFAKKNHYTYPPMNPATRQKLVKFFKPYNDRLTKLLGPDFCWKETES